jgi:serpin B
MTKSQTMKHIVLFAAFLTLLASCQKPSDNNPDNFYKPLNLSTRSAEFIRQGEPFAFEFIDRIHAEEKGDFIISPLSMQILLGMILDGAQGTTADEISRVLGYGAGETDAVNEFCRSMLTQLPKLDQKTTLTMANALFVDDGWPLLDSYQSTVRKYYDAEIANLNFADGAASLKAINGWCADHTNGLIPKILDEVDPNMLAYLLNAMYFKSQWVDKFQPSYTQEEKFMDESGRTAPVQMMRRTHENLYYEDDILQAVTLPYGNGAFSMTVFLPQPKHTVADVIASLKKTNGHYDMVGCEVELWLPRFETKYHVNLNDILSAMGMPSAFGGAADFKAMSAYAGHLSFVQQDAVIKVDEEGAEAAVVSSAGIEKATAAAPGSFVVFHADHPFLYLITETSTGAVLFAGRYGAK